MSRTGGCFYEWKAHDTSALAEAEKGSALLPLNAALSISALTHAFKYFIPENKNKWISWYTCYSYAMPVVLTTLAWVLTAYSSPDGLEKFWYSAAGAASVCVLNHVFSSIRGDGPLEEVRKTSIQEAYFIRWMGLVAHKEGWDNRFRLYYSMPRYLKNA